MIEFMIGFSVVLASCVGGVILGKWLSELYGNSKKYVTSGYLQLYPFSDTGTTYKITCSPIYNPQSTSLGSPIYRIDINAQQSGTYSSPESDKSKSTKTRKTSVGKTGRGTRKSNPKKR